MPTNTANISKAQDIIDAAKKKLTQGFGFELREAANKVSYFLVIQDEPNRGKNMVKERKLRARILNSNEELKKWRGLVSIVVQTLILHGGKCEKDIFCHQFFDKLDTDYFGSRKQIITELKQQKWIEEEKEQNDDRVYVKVGPRADIETTLEYQYISAYKLFNGHFPDPQNDRALQRITQDKRVQNRLNGVGRGQPAAQRKSYRERAMARGRTR